MTAYLIFLKGLCGYVLVNVLPLLPVTAITFVPDLVICKLWEEYWYVCDVHNIECPYWDLSSTVEAVSMRSGDMKIKQKKCT